MYLTLTSFKTRVKVLFAVLFRMQSHFPTKKPSKNLRNGHFSTLNLHLQQKKNPDPYKLYIS